MTSKQYENLVAKVFEKKGYDTKVPSRTRDYGVSFIAEKEGKSLAIQVKKYNDDTQVSYQDVMLLFAGKHYLDCDYALLVTNNSLMPEAVEVAEKLHVKFYENWMPKE